MASHREVKMRGHSGRASLITYVNRDLNVDILNWVIENLCKLGDQTKATIKQGSKEKLLQEL